MKKNSLFRHYCQEKTHINHLLQIMKITFILFFLGTYSLFANEVYSQKAKVSVNERNVVLETVLDKIEAQTDYLFIYSKSNVDVSKKVSLRVKDKPVSEILDEVFEGTDIVYTLEGAHIILSKKGTMPSDATVAPEQSQKQITGIVTDDSGEPLPGVSIKLKGGTTGTITGSDGTYSIQVSDETGVLVYSYLGFLTEERAVSGRTSINVTLKEDVLMMDEVIVVGYGTQSKRKMISSVSTVDMGNIEALPTSSIVNNLGGRAPGIIVTGQGGGPGNNSNISIRGGGVPNSSTQGGGTPLVVIDGVVSEYSLFSNMNPSDIENLSILKDASAAAIYGSRAGNGIILVTTKKGTKKGLTINYDFNYSMSQPTVLPKKIGSYESALYRNESYKNDNLAPFYSDEVVEKYRTGSDPYNYPNVDWQDLALNSYAPEYKHNLSIDGGSDKNNYYASLSYYNQGSLYTQNTNTLDLYTARLNVTNSFDNIGLKTTTGVSGTFRDLNSPYYDYYSIWGHIQNKSPMTLAYNDLGEYYTVGDHPLVEMDARSGYNRRSTNNMNGMFKAEWSVPHVEGLKFTSLSNYYMSYYKRKAWKDMAPQYALGSTIPVSKNPPELTLQYSQSYTYTQQFLVDYNRKISDFTIGLLAGYEFSKGFDSSLTGSRENYQLDVDQLAAGPTDNMKNSGSEAEFARAGYIGRFKADYKAKYLLEASIRHDGSDWFPKDKRWGTFYSFSGGWVISDEAFMQNLKDNNILNLLKLRGSYGVVGLDGDLTSGLSNDSPFKLQRFSYVPGYNLDGRAYVINNNYVQGFREGDLVSPDITWYTATSREFGFDFESLQYKLFGGFSYFYNRTTGYLTSPSNVGYTDPLGISLPRIKSDGAERKEGFEFNIGYKNNAGDFSYQVSANYSYYNKLWENNPTESENNLNQPRIRNVHQNPYNRVGLKVAGFYTSEEDILNSPRRLNSVNLRPGDLKYVDVDGNGFIDNNDRVRLGYGGDPQSMYGINLDFKYKGIFMNLFFQGSGKKDFYLGDQVRAQNGVVYPFQSDYWTPTNTDAKYPRLISGPSYNGTNNYQESEFWIVSASYFRLKALQIGYDLKYKLLKKTNFISSARVVLSGTNLFTISDALDYYYDPESTGQGNNYNYPYQRVYSVSFNIGF